ncbi:MAG: tetratricopeptide repeat protein [Gemmatimonadetes bacterium]|nr:tetratricopeptide repeat protein [Gemmatimonadota bacterium]
MEQRRTMRTWAGAAALALVGMLLAAAPGAALQAQQAGGRFRVLIPALEREGSVKPDFGKAVAEDMRKLINSLATHAPVEKKDFQDALRKFKLKEEELDCIKSRQLAVQLGAELVMCGTYGAAGAAMQVGARFISAKTGESFEVAAFTAPDAKQAAQHIFTSFENYVNQLRLTAFCLEYLGSQQWENALTNCNRSLEINAHSVTALYGKARALMELDSLAQSLALHRQVLELNPVHQDALLTAGIVAIKLNQQEVARGYFHQYLELNPGNVDVRLKVATDMAKAGDPEGALRLVEEGLQQEAGNLTLAEYAGHFALAAAQKLEEAARTGANGGSAGRSAEAVKLYETALGHYEKVFASKGAEAESAMLNNMLATLGKLERYQQAVELGARVIAAKPGDATLWSAYASALENAGRLEEALAALDSALAKDPKTPQVYSRQGLWLVQAGQLARARAAFQKAVERKEIESDEAARAVFSAGYNEKFRKGQQEAALEYFMLARELASGAETRAMGSYWSGQVLYQKGLRLQQPGTAASAKDALPIFQRALEFFEQSGACGNTQPCPNLQRFIDASKQYIQIQELLIKRGR